MASEKALKLIEEIKTLTVIELSELVKALEEEFGVSAAAPVMVGAPVGGAAAAPVVEEKTEFDVILKAAGDKKLEVIRAVKDLTGLGLKESKDLVEGAPATVKEGLSKDDANAYKEKLTSVGATVEIK